MRVLLIEDEQLIADALIVSMVREGYHVEWVPNAARAEEVLIAAEFNLVLLDLGLPGHDGLSLLRWMRDKGRNEPVVILTARDAVQNRIEGLDLGADDYMTKPFDMSELLARVRMQVGRSNGRVVSKLVHGDVEIDLAAHTVTQGGKVVELAPLAFQVLVMLLERKGRVISKDSLAESLYGWEEGVESNTVEVYISQIRKRLHGDLIRTIRGVGYIIDKK